MMVVALENANYVRSELLDLILPPFFTLHVECAHNVDEFVRDDLTQYSR